MTEDHGGVLFANFVKMIMATTKINYLSYCLMNCMKISNSRIRTAKIVKYLERPHINSTTKERNPTWSARQSVYFSENKNWFFWQEVEI